MREKKLLAVLLCALLLLCACGEKTHVFRAADLGMSKAKVAKTESQNYDFASDELLLYNTTMFDYDAEVYYYFTDDALTGAECRFPIGERTINDDMERFAEIAALLTAQYGEPVDADFRRFLTSDESEKTDPDNLLIYRNVLEYYLEWDGSGYTATLLLNYKDAQVTLLYAVAKA
ncbi:MAG: hypothetical protein VB092_00430 [Oscillospiraceae bacterium]|nr:hypothetical protein [Oscillospiraceae bacterium]